ncbi:MAG: hypothetical protein V1903_06230 [Bacteroidota bacterium]
MKDKVTIPELLPDPKEEDKKAAARRREDYARTRDLQAEEYNESIVRRMARDKENQKP